MVEAKPIECACCGETETQEPFVQLLVPCGDLKPGDLLRPDCARRLGFDVPPIPCRTFRITLD